MKSFMRRLVPSMAIAIACGVSAAHAGDPLGLKGMAKDTGKAVKQDAQGQAAEAVAGPKGQVDAAKQAVEGAKGDAAAAKDAKAAAKDAANAEAQGAAAGAQDAVIQGSHDAVKRALGAPDAAPAQ